MRDELRRLALFGSGVAELTVNRAEKIVREFVKAGDVRSGEVPEVVRDLVERSRANRREIARFVRAELRSQIESLGLATKRDLERLDRRVTRLEDRAKAAPKKTTAKKTTAKKTTSRQTKTTRSKATLAHEPPRRSEPPEGTPT